MTYKLYTTRKYRRYFDKDVRRRKISGVPFDDTQIAIEHVNSGLVAVDTATGAFGIFDAAGRLVPSSIQLRGKTGQFIPDIKNINPEFIDVDAIFMGNIFPHFGHFLLEHLNRAWGALRLYKPGVKVLFIDNRNIGAQGFVYDFMDMLGIRRDDVMVVARSVRFRTVYVPAQSWVTQHRVHTDFFKAFDAMAANVPDADTVYDKVYLSRAALPAHMKVFGEERVQDIFAKNGYKIIYPEQLPLSQQVAIVKNAKYLAGCGGTALHLALFMRSGGCVIQIKRNKAVKDNGPVQWMMNAGRGVNSVFVDASIEKVKTDHSSVLPQIIGVTEHMRRFFDDNGFDYSAADMAWNAEAWEKYSVALHSWNAEHGTVFANKTKRLIVKLTSMFVPGRERRGRFRRRLKQKLKIA